MKKYETALKLSTKIVQNSVQVELMKTYIYKWQKYETALKPSTKIVQDSVQVELMKEWLGARKHLA